MLLPQPDEGAFAPPTRARIFAFLTDRRSPIGTEELAEHFGLHPNGVRRHLDRLESDGLVVRGKLKAAKGRPRDNWCVAPGAASRGERPQAYEDLARWLTRAVPKSAARLREVERIGLAIGRELAPPASSDPIEDFRDVVATMGFEPTIDPTSDGFACRLGNCPYRDSARENPDVVCRLHRGITVGILAGLDGGAELKRFEPHDPEAAGCAIEVRTTTVN